MEWVVAVAVPVIIVLATGGLRTAIRGGYFLRGDYCLSVELVLAGLAAIIAYAVELNKRAESHHVVNELSGRANMAVLVWIIAGGVLLLIFVLLHLNFEERLSLLDAPKRVKMGQLQKCPTVPDWSFWSHPSLWLLVVANLVGIGYMAGFLHIVRTMP